MPSKTTTRLKPRAKPPHVEEANKKLLGVASQTISAKAVRERVKAEQPQRRKVIVSPEVVVIFDDAPGMTYEARLECARWLRKLADRLDNFGHEWMPGQKFRFPPEPV